MMKSKDCAVATALVLNGYLRANEGETLSKAGSDRHLADALRAIRLECGDWGECLSSEDAALEPDAITVVLLEDNGGGVSRSPYNLISAAVALAQEAVDLNGPDVISDLINRIKGATKQPEPKSVMHLIEAADTLAAAIDASTDRPVAKLEAWHALIADLQHRLGVKVEERCIAPANW